MAKPMLVTLPFVLLLLDVWPLARLRLGWRRLILEKLPFVALAAASMVITFLVQLYGGAVAELGEIPPAHRIANALTSYGLYVVKMIWPSRLTIFYPYPLTIPAWQPIAGLIFSPAAPLPRCVSGASIRTCRSAGSGMSARCFR